MAFDQCGDSKSVLGIPKHKLATSEKQSSDCGVTYLPLGNPKDNLLLLPEANGVSRGVQPRLPRTAMTQTSGYRQTSLYDLKNKKRTWDT